MNRNYELMFIVRPDMVDEDLNKLISTLESSVTAAGGTAKSEVWGKRRLAYRVGKFNDGIFVLMMIEATGAIVHEVERRLRVTEPVIKFLTVRTDEELKRLDKIKKIRDSKKKASAQPAAAAAPVTPATPEAGDGNAGLGPGLGWGRILVGRGFRSVRNRRQERGRAPPPHNRTLRKQEHYGRRNKSTERGIKPRRKPSGA